jgi:hypothetical protein
MTKSEIAKGQSYTTGTVHYARTDGHGLVQTCGIKANQIAYLAATDAEVTCRKCQASAPRTTPKATAPERRTYGRQEWTITDLRDVAKELGIQGRTRKSGDELLAEIVAIRPQFA